MAKPHQESPNPPRISQVFCSSKLRIGRAPQFPRRPRFGPSHSMAPYWRQQNLAKMTWDGPLGGTTNKRSCQGFHQVVFVLKKVGKSSKWKNFNLENYEFVHSNPYSWFKKWLKVHHLLNFKLYFTTWLHMIETPASSSWSIKLPSIDSPKKMDQDNCLLERRWTSGPGMGTNRQAIGSTPREKKWCLHHWKPSKTASPRKLDSETCCWVNPVYLDGSWNNVMFFFDFEKNWWNYLW